MGGEGGRGVGGSNKRSSWNKWLKKWDYSQDQHRIDGSYSLIKILKNKDTRVAGKTQNIGSPINLLHCLVYFLFEGRFLELRFQNYLGNFKQDPINAVEVFKFIYKVTIATVQNQCKGENSHSF